MGGKIKIQKRPTIPKFKDWYYSMIRYHLYADLWKLENLADEKWRISFRRWSWLHMLLPLETNEDTTNDHIYFRRFGLILTPAISVINL